MDKQISWTAASGKQIVVEALGYKSYRVTVDGKVLGKGGLNTAAKAIPIVAYREGIRGILMTTPPVGVNAERVAALQAMDRAITDERQAVYMADPRREMERLEDALHQAREDLTRHGYGDTGVRGTAVEQAEAALAAWKSANAQTWETVRAERQAERERHQAELRQSFIARGLD